MSYPLPLDLRQLATALLGQLQVITPRPLELAAHPAVKVGGEGVKFGHRDVVSRPVTTSASVIVTALVGLDLELESMALFDQRRAALR